MATDSSPPILSAYMRSAEFDAALLRVRRVVGREAISQPFSFDVDVVVGDIDGLDGDKVIGALVSLVFEDHGAPLRTVHGMVSSFVDLLDPEPSYNSYRLRVVPRLHRLTFVDTQEVFLNISVPDLVKHKLSLVNLGPDDVSFHLLQKYPEREIIVQYRETDLAFVSRLLEHLGISYYFEHDADHDRIVFTDHNPGFAHLERLPTMRYGGHDGRSEHTDVYAIESERNLFPAGYVVYDYDYRAPQLELTSTYEHPQGYAGGVAEYGSHHRSPAEGNMLARVRAEERDARSRFFRAESTYVDLTAGALVKLVDHPRLADPTLLVVEVEHNASFPVGTDAGDAAAGYMNKVKAVDASRSYRPPRVTPRPRIHGLLTGITEPAAPGASGQVAQIDSMGRYTVRFFFDVAADDGRLRSSAPTRMAQPHAGENYGMHFPLKPSTEVTVAFLDGDPDRPIITASVPNPVIGSPVTRSDAIFNRIKSQSGALIEFKDR
jgi:type VI secretion system secreted protein VgrG